MTTTDLFDKHFINKVIEYVDNLLAFLLELFRLLFKQISPEVN
jgi:hypothetical protein